MPGPGEIVPVTGLLKVTSIAVELTFVSVMDPVLGPSSVTWFAIRLNGNIKSTTHPTNSRRIAVLLIVEARSLIVKLLNFPCVPFGRKPLIFENP